MLGIAACAAGQVGPDANADSTLFGSIPIVEAAALHSQTLREAPADVSIISSEDIRKYGYRTLNEALASVRGFFTSSDGIYHYVGVRGFSLPGDYNTRFLVMLNGHPLTDQVYDANDLYGQDLGIDMDLIERIEVIRGPSSALYGSNGMLANINVVTKSPVDSDRFSVSTENGSYGDKKLMVSGSAYLGHGMNLLVSASVFNIDGSSLRFPGVSQPVTGVNGDKGYHTFANLVWHNWSFTAYFNDRVKQPPLPWGTSALSFARGDSVSDSRNFFLAAWTHNVGPGKLLWQIYYDQYRYHDRFYYAIDSSLPAAGSNIEDLRSIAYGDTIGSQASWQVDLKRIGEFTAGMQFDGQLQNLQQNYTVSPQVAYSPAISHPDLKGGVFVQQQWRLSKAIAVYGGLRADRTRNAGTSLSPRLAVVLQQSRQTTWKLVYGRPFRNPSAFEQYYTDGGLAFLANPALRPESAQTLEGSVEHRLSAGLSITAGMYDYRLSNLIAANFNADGVQKFENTSSSRSSGMEFEMDAKAWSRFESNVSYSIGSAKVDNQSSAGVPSQIAKFRVAAPFWGRKLWLSNSWQYMSSRADLAGTALRPVVLGDVTLTASSLLACCDVTAGVRNIAGWKYSDPTALALPQMPADGRSIFLKITYRRAQ